MVSNPSNKVKNESIDEVILRLLGLKPGVEIDYQTYHDILKKKLSSSRLIGKEIPREEDELLRSEFKRVRSLKDKGLRFKIKKIKVKSSEENISQSKFLPSSGAIVKSKANKKSQQNIVSVNAKDITQIAQANDLSGIKKTLDSILSTLSSTFKFDQKRLDQERRDKETEKRGKRESTLEGFKKGVAGIVATTKKMLDPFQAIIDRIWRFVFFTLLGRAFTKFMEWMGDKQNQNKFNSFIEFLSDHWPALAGLYILFGTSFGKLVRGLLKGVVRMSVALAMNIPKIARFIKSKPRLASAIIGVGALASGYLSREVQGLFADKKESPEVGSISSQNSDLDSAKKSVDQASNAKVSKFNFVGMIPKFNLGGMIPSFTMGGFNPYGGIPITGAGQDDTLIAAKTGEAILTEKDQSDLGQRFVDRNTGQPLNIPQYLAGRKPGTVNMGNLGFPGFGGGFFGGGVINKFNNGGVVGSTNNKFNTGDVVDSAINKFNTGGIVGNVVRGAKNLWNTVTSRFRPRPQKAGPKLAPEIVRNSARRESRQLTRSAQSLMDERWSASSVGIDPTVGCAAAIKEIYKRSGVDLPWSNSKNPNYVPDIHSFLDKKFSKVSEKDRKPGDIVIWKDSGDPPYGHIGIVMSDGRIANNSSSKGTFTNLNTPQDAKSWWPNTQQLLYFRDPRIAQLSTLRNGSSKNQPLSSQRLFGNLMSRVVGKKDGGIVKVKENSGIDILGGTRDRQLVALEPGEGVLTKNIMYALFGGSEEKFNRFSAFFDPHSRGAKFERSNINRPKITPYGSSGMDGMITLPPIIQGSGGGKARASGSSGGSRVPVFSHISEFSDRATIATIYGIEELV